MTKADECGFVQIQTIAISASRGGKDETIIDGGECD